MAFNLIKLAFTNHKGTGHKAAHNLTTLANIPLVAWLIYAVFSLRNASYGELVMWIAAPLNTAIAIIFVLVTLTHFILELEVVFEDYIADIKVRHLVVNALKIFWLALGAASILSILKLGLYI